MSPEQSRESLQRYTSYGMRIGCFGISANPPHRGHLETARVIRDSGFVDEVWIIPVFKHPFDGNHGKERLAPWGHRLAMSRHLEELRIRISEVEKERGGISYTIETLAHLRKRYPEHTFYWCTGSDAIAGEAYKKWHRWRELEEREKILVTGRPGYSLGEGVLEKCFAFVGETGGTSISSTAIRRMAREGEDVSAYVGKTVAKYIKKHNLYIKGGAQ